jgi:ATP-binding cassette subfamily B protein
VIHSLRERPGLSLALALCVALSVGLSLVPPQILKRVVDLNLARGRGEGLPLMAGLYLLTIALGGLFDFLKDALLSVIGQGITRRVRERMMEKLGRLGALYFSANGTGAVASRFTNDVETINSLFTGGVVGMAVDCLKIIGIVVSIWLFSPWLGVVTFLVLPVIWLITRFFQKRMLGAETKNRSIVAGINGHLSESLRNARAIKIFHREGYMEGRYSGYLEEGYRSMERVNFYDSIFSPIIQVLRALVIILVVFLFSKAFRISGLSLGMAAASIELISNLFSPIETLGMEIQGIQEAVSGVRRVNDFINEPEDGAKDGTLTSIALIPNRKRVELSFNNISFAYGNGTEVLTDIDLRLAPMEKVTFVGRTGVGKSTLFRLAMGLLRPTRGSVTLNGKDVFSIPHAEKKRLFGSVDQGFSLVLGTVLDQVRLFDPEISQESAERALDFVGLLDYVKALPRGLDTAVAGDGLFSQGQKQLLAIARAIVLDPPILFLDEMTANLDSLTERKIVSVLKRAGEARTILSISHRPSSMLSSDRVVILEKGRVRASGSPEELLQVDEWYRSRVTLERLTWD